MKHIKYFLIDKKSLNMMHFAKEEVDLDDFDEEPVVDLDDLILDESMQTYDELICEIFWADSWDDDLVQDDQDLDLEIVSDKISKSDSLFL